MRRVSWLKAALREFENFPEQVRRQIAFGLDRADEGGKADAAVSTSGWCMPSRRNRFAESRRQNGKSI
jgi:phage-related protein